MVVFHLTADAASFSWFSSMQKWTGSRFAVAIDGGTNRQSGICSLLVYFLLCSFHSSRSWVVHDFLLTPKINLVATRHSECNLTSSIMLIARHVFANSILLSFSLIWPFREYSQNFHTWKNLTRNILHGCYIGGGTDEIWRHQSIVWI